MARKAATTPTRKRKASPATGTGATIPAPLRIRM